MKQTDNAAQNVAIALCRKPSFTKETHEVLRSL